MASRTVPLLLVSDVGRFTEMLRFEDLPDKYDRRLGVMSGNKLLHCPYDVLLFDMRCQIAMNET